MTRAATLWRSFVRAPISWALAVLVQGVGIAGTIVVLALVTGIHQKRPDGIDDPRREIVEVRRVAR